MILRLRIGNWRFTTTFIKVQDVIGVNSILPDGQHILMWDFDDTEFIDVLTSLKNTQEQYDLSNIYVLNTGKPNSYIAYCFKKVPWQKAVEIIASTPFICWEYFRWAIIRKHFTLRVTAKSGRKPKLAYIIPSNQPEDTTIDELNSWVKYETLPDEADRRRLEIGYAKKNR